MRQKGEPGAVCRVDRFDRSRGDLRIRAEAAAAKRRGVGMKVRLWLFVAIAAGLAAFIMAAARVSSLIIAGPAVICLLSLIACVVLQDKWLADRQEQRMKLRELLAESDRLSERYHDRESAVA